MNLFHCCWSLSAERREPSGDGSHLGHTEAAEDGHAWSTAAAGPVQRVQEERQAATAGRQTVQLLARLKTNCKHTQSVKDGEMCISLCRAGCCSGPGCSPRWGTGHRTDPQCSPTRRHRRQRPLSRHDRTTLLLQRSRCELFHNVFRLQEIITWGFSIKLTLKGWLSSLFLA